MGVVIRGFLLVLSFCTGILYGYVSFNWELFPFRLVQDAYAAIREALDPPPPPEEFIRSRFVTHIDTPAGAEKLRAAARSFVFGERWSAPGEPIAFSPIERYTPIGEPDGPAFDIDASVSTARIRTIGKAISKIYLFEPREPSKRLLVIYHQGHRGALDGSFETIKALVGAGYTVVGMQMPMVGENKEGFQFLTRDLRQVEVRSHNDFAGLTYADLGFDPLLLFLKPIKTVVDHFDADDRFDAIAMVGISGGGWSTVLYSALDTRIVGSFPVAGAVPMPVRYFHSPGDWEQKYEAFYSRFSYNDLFILGALPGGRRQVQILNFHDPVGFMGDLSLLHGPYLAERLRALGMTGNEVTVLSDTTHRQHILSPWARQVILKELDALSAR